MLRSFLRATVPLAFLLAVPAIGVDAESAQAVAWRSPYQENETTVIPGVLRASFGAFELRWLVGPGGGARLVSTEPGGSAEVPLRQKSVLMLNERDGSTVLFEEWFPLLNQRKPTRLNEIAVVSTSSLFSVVAAGASPPAFPIDKSARSIRWGERSVVAGVEYRKGVVKGAAGAVAIAWRIAPETGPELLLLNDPWAEAGAGDSTRLYLWTSDADRAAVLLRVEPWRVDVLRPVIAVSAKSLLSGL